MAQPLYVTKEQGKNYSFPEDYKQVFDHPFEMSRVYNEAYTIKTFIADDKERQIGLEVLKLLYDYTFATREQLERLLRAKGFENVAILDTMIPKYLERRLINRFTLAAFDMEKIPDDAFIVYCLDHASRHILSHLYRDEIAVTWKSTNPVRGAEIAAKYLATNDFYLSVLSAKSKTLESFFPTVNYSIGSRDIRMSAQFCIKNGATPVNFVLDVIRKADLRSGYWNRKVGEHIRPFFENNRFWNRYFHSAPILLFLVEDFDDIEKVARVFYDGMNGVTNFQSNFRIITTEAVRQSIDKVQMYKYDPARTDVKVVVSNSKIFQKDI